MLRIAKSTPGVLDLSAVRDEHGLPVTLIGPSHRDVPDHEGSNPVLQRIVELGWVTVEPVSLEPAQSTEVSAPASIGVDENPPPSSTSDAPATEAGDAEDQPPSAEPPIAPPPMSDTPIIGVVDQQTPVSDASAEPAQDEPARPEGSARPSGKSDVRKAGRRS